MEDEDEDGRTITTRRRSVKAHRCGVCEGWIKSGSVYLRHSAPPPGKRGGSGWQVTKECARCAGMFGRTALLGEGGREQG